MQQAHGCAADRAPKFLSNGLATKPGCLLLVTFLVTSLGIEKQEEDEEGNVEKR